MVGAAEASNRISGNLGAGVVIANSTGNTIRGNRIYANGDIGIDLGSDGITFNHLGYIDGAEQLSELPGLDAGDVGWDEHPRERDAGQHGQHYLQHRDLRQSGM